MIKVKRIDHVAIAVGDCDVAAQRLGDLFGLCVGAREHVGSQGVDVAFLHADCGDDADGGAGAGATATAAPRADADDSAGDDGAAIEFIAPAGSPGNAGVSKFLERRGPGLHHICFEVDDLPATLASLKAAGVRLIDEIPRPGARGHLVAFLHPASTGGVLFELCATPHGAQA